MDSPEIPATPKRTRETQIRRDRLGRWWNGEDEIDHPNVSSSFDSWIDRAEDGRFCLKNDINWAYVEVEGPPYRVLSIVKTVDGSFLSPLSLCLTGGLCEALEPASLVQDPDGVLWCTVREGRVPAVFENHAATQIGSLFLEDDKGPYLSVDGVHYRPKTVVDPLQLGATAK